MRSWIIVVATSLGLTGAAWADGAATVKVEQPRRGGERTLITAYGQAAAASQSVRSLTLPQGGQVTAVLVVAGQAVKRGQPLLRFAVAPAAVAGFAQAKSALKLASEQQRHTQELLAQQLATKDQLSAADKALTDAKAALAAQSQDGAGRSNIVLRAPFTGVMSAVAVNVGDRPAAGAALASLAPASALQVSVGVEAGWRSRLRVGETIPLQPLAGGPATLGRMVRVDSALNAKTRLVDVDIAVGSGAAISGEAFRAEIPVGVVQGWLVPHGAVLVDDSKAWIFQVEGGKAVRVPVTVLQAGRTTDVVSGALDPERPLVTVGAYQLDDGAAVRVER